jgi:hypothetical protein
MRQYGGFVLQLEPEHQTRQFLNNNGFHRPR